MRKRILCCILALCLVLPIIAACANDPAPAEPAPAAPEPAVTEPAAPEPATEAEEPPAVEPDPVEAAFTAGVFTGESRSGWGEAPIVVEVEFSETEILRVEILSHSETAGMSDPALEMVPIQVVEYQTLMVDAVAGGTVTRNAILEAIMEAVTAADGNFVDLMANPIVRVPGPPVTIDVDVVVIGAGGAGLAAAATALENDASVLLLEKTAAIGGNTLAGGFAWNAIHPRHILDTMDPIPDQNAFLSTFLDYDPADFAAGFDEALVILQGQITEFLASGEAETTHFDTLEFWQTQLYTGSIRYELDGTRVYSDFALADIMTRYSRDAIDWIESEAIGGRLRDRALGEPGGAMWRRATAPYPDRHTGVLDPLLDYIISLGGELMLSTRATEILVEDGAAVGVLATKADGTQLTINAGSVVIATGGFAANRAMVYSYNNFWENLNPNILTTNVWTALGDGIIMGQAIGADVTQMGITQLMPMAFRTTGLLAGGAQRGIIYVNPQGERFMNEVNERDTIAAGMFDQGGVVFEIRRQQDSNPGLDAIVGDGSGRAYAGTLEELAEQFGMDPDVLIATVESFNEAYIAGTDEFGRIIFDNDLAEGPWVARVMSPSTHYTNGGLVTTVEARVVNVDGETIPNLFAAGEVMGGIHGGNRLGGNAVAEAFVFGRIAGEQAAINAR